MAKRTSTKAAQSSARKKQRLGDHKVIRPDERGGRLQHDEDDENDMREYAGFAKFLGDLRPTELQTQKRWGAKSQAATDAKPREGQRTEQSDAVEEPLSDGSDRSTLSADEATDIDTDEEDRLMAKLRRTQTKHREAQRRLPIKLSDGSMQTVPLPHMITHEVIPDEAEPEDAAANTPLVPKQTTEATMTEQETMNDTLERLARVASSIVEDPEENFEKLATLWFLHEETADLTIQRFALVSMTSVFKDIVPGYRIRPLSDAELKEKVTKDVRRLRAFEQGLLSYYRRFVKRLTGLAQSGRHPELAQAAMGAACAMLSSHAHFNLATDLIALLVERICRNVESEADTPTHDLAIVDQCHRTLSEVCRQDEEGDVTLEIARLLCKRLKERHYKVPARAIDVCLHFRMATELTHRASTTKVDAAGSTTGSDGAVKRKERQFRNKKQRKAMREQKEIEREMQEASAAVDLEAREKAQGETLKLVFGLYLHLLKDGPRRSKTAALIGLARFSHLVNLDFFGDLLEVLKELISDAASMPETGGDALRNDHYILFCISTALRLLAGQPSTKETISLDLSPFVHHLYRISMALCLDQAVQPVLQGSVAPADSSVQDSSDITLAETLVRCLDVVLFERRAPGHLRSLAFCKRMLSACVNVSDDRAAHAMLSLVQRLKVRDSASRIEALFSSDDLIVGEGRFDPAQTNYELSNATSALGFELCLLRKHYAPRIRTIMQELVDG